MDQLNPERGTNGPIRTIWIENENPNKVICKVAELAEVTNVLSNQINIAHYTSNWEAVPATVFFFKKNKLIEIISIARKKRINDWHINQITRDSLMLTEDDVNERDPKT